jgi:hypothetical protein
MNIFWKSELYPNLNIFEKSEQFSNKNISKKSELFSNMNIFENMIFFNLKKLNTKKNKNLNNSIFKSEQISDLDNFKFEQF